ncbi:MAG TPA: fructose-6-phosphate aldolase [Thermotogota bacterium]|nr:fructose-6-phosphate aldolase [Thermotogota bacterium]HRW92643.1 fructose-6-phosphate aldolase [Thermotogota bacterium]
MDFFVDTANLGQIEKASAWGILDGVTTNPSLIAKENVRDFHGHIRKICEIVKGPVSAEVVSKDLDGMLGEARELASISEHVVVKIPMTETGIQAVATLSKESIKTNVTLVFSPSQALLAAKAGATYASVFLGRVDDISWDAFELVSNVLDIYQAFPFETRLIAASIRHPRHVWEVARMGCHVGTVPFDVLDKLFHHPLTDIGIQRFDRDWNELQKRLGKE